MQPMGTKTPRRRSFAGRKSRRSSNSETIKSRNTKNKKLVRGIKKLYTMTRSTKKRLPSPPSSNSKINNALIKTNNTNVKSGIKLSNGLSYCNSLAPPW